MNAFLKYKVLLLFAMLFAVAGCVTTGRNDCAGWKPIRLAPQSIDALTDQDAAEILAHNVFGRERGCW